MNTITIDINPRDASDYHRFLRCKALPAYSIASNDDHTFTVCTDPVSYAAVFGGDVATESDLSTSAPHLFPFQKDIVERALSRQMFAMFMDCGLGKTPSGLSWGVEVARKGYVLILCPLAVLSQWKREARRFHGVRLADLRAGEEWGDGDDIAIVNYEAARDIDMSKVRGVILDESSILKNPTGR
ncbi:MAG: hypothetical protein AAFV53_38955, partial [Myxococcota bacterium]